MLRIILILIIGLSTIQAAQAGQFDHQKWDQLLKAHVISIRNEQATEVDYNGLVRDHTLLKNYLAELSTIGQDEFDQWSKDAQLAFLLNAYNAWTVELVLTGYPNINSIRDLGNFFSSPFSKDIVLLFGGTISLDDIEKGLILGSDRYNDFRVHFALNCASIGCPALRVEAYNSEQLDSQLDNQMKFFLGDQTRNRLEGDTLKVSSIFKWYRKDFENSSTDIHSLEDFFTQYVDFLNLSKSNINLLQSGEIDIKYLDYDWDLNVKQE